MLPLQTIPACFAHACSRVHALYSFWVLVTLVHALTLSASQVLLLYDWMVTAWSLVFHHHCVSDFCVHAFPRL